MDSVAFHISEASQRSGVTPEHLRVLERQDRIPPARRDLNGCIYFEFGIALLRSIGVGSRRKWLTRPEVVLEAGK
jgi:hypothetical protein